MPETDVLYKNRDIRKKIITKINCESNQNKLISFLLQVWAI